MTPNQGTITMTTASANLAAENTRRPASSRPPSLALIDIAGIAGLGAIIAIHTSELSGTVDETAYLGLGYVALIAASIVAIVLLAQRDVRGWVLGGLTAAPTLIGFTLTRTTGLPRANGDIGNWGEKIAVWSLLAEAVVVALAVFAVRKQSRPTGRSWSRSERG
jgi:hypothetical protein